MTLSDATRLANRRGWATADFNLVDHARYEALPQFIRDVRMVIGNPYWAWKRSWFHFVPGQDSYDLPLDFGRMVELRPYWNNQCCNSMVYVGEAPHKVLSSSYATPNGSQYVGNACCCGYPHRHGGYYVEHTQNRWTLGPIELADYGFAYSVNGEWPPFEPATVNAGSPPAIFASRDNEAEQPYSYSTGFIRFDTSALPTEATIIGATLRLYIASPIINDDRKTLLIEWYNDWPIDENDYTPTPVDGAWLGSVSRLNVGLNELQLADTTQIDRFGFTGLRLQLNNTKPTGINNVQLDIQKGAGPFAEVFTPDFDKGAAIVQGTSLEIRYTVPIVYPFQLRLTGPVETPYDAEGLYNWVIPPLLDTDLDQYMPPDMQGLLVHKIRCDILKDAFGQGDGRYQSEREEYDAALETLLPMSEAGPKRKASYVR